MKNSLMALVFSAVLFLNSSAFASVEYCTHNGEKQLCFAGEIMEEVFKEAAKETVNTLGKRFIKKYLKEKQPDNGQSEENAANQDPSESKGSEES